MSWGYKVRCKAITFYLHRMGSSFPWTMYKESIYGAGGCPFASFPSPTPTIHPPPSCSVLGSQRQSPALWFPIACGQGEEQRQELRGLGEGSWSFILLPQLAFFAFHRAVHGGCSVPTTGSRLSGFLPVPCWPFSSGVLMAPEVLHHPHHCHSPFLKLAWVTPFVCATTPPSCLDLMEVQPFPILWNSGLQLYMWFSNLLQSVSDPYLVSLSIPHCLIPMYFNTKQSKSPIL